MMYKIVDGVSPVDGGTVPIKLEKTVDLKGKEVKLFRAIDGDVGTLEDSLNEINASQNEVAPGPTSVDRMNFFR